MASVDNFSPFPGGCIKVAASTTSGGTANALASVGQLGSRALKVWNAGVYPAFFAVGDAGLSTDAAGPSPALGCPVPPGSDQVFDIGGATHIAIETLTGASDVYCQLGFGS